MSDLIVNGAWVRITAAAISATKPSFAAVAYFGSKGHKLLPLRAGSKLVVDASLAAVTTGITDPKALRRLHDGGVSIFSMPLLHAKVFAFDTVGYVGSTNVSQNSASRLIEANLAVSDVKTLTTGCGFSDLGGLGWAPGNKGLTKSGRWPSDC